MTERNPGKFNDIYKLLSLHDFAMNVNVSEDLKCNKCSKILVNACQGPCGCRYCMKCIDDMLNNCDTCPGNTEFCKDESLSNYSPDYASNKKILKLVVKCPKELCRHECELINMEEHIRMCSNKCIKCPFYGLGCDDDKLVVDKMGDHLQLEGYNHNKILIDLIGDLRNEVNELKQKIEKQEQEIDRNKDQIEILKDHSSMKDETIAEMQQQIRSIKQEKQQMATEINNLKVELDNKIGNLREEMTKEWRDNLGRETRRINDEMEKWQLQLTSTTDGVEKQQNRPIEAALSWRVDQISNKRQNRTDIYSEIFYPKTSPYKMKLRMLSGVGSDELYIRLYIYNDENDAHLQWPFQGKVTIQICNQSHPNVSKPITKYCNIPKPNYNSYKNSEWFIFSFAELSRAGVIQNDYLIVECNIE